MSGVARVRHLGSEEDAFLNSVECITGGHPVWSPGAPPWDCLYHGQLVVSPSNLEGLNSQVKVTQRQTSPKAAGQRRCERDIGYSGSEPALCHRYNAYAQRFGLLCLHALSGRKVLPICMA